ncbi:MAG: hypothetical protein ABIF08_00710 [Nanoarchaeota archaeon]
MPAKPKTKKVVKGNSTKIFSDLKIELEKLKAQKKDYDTALKTMQEDIKIVQDNQLKLRDKISQLVARETNLTAKRMRIEEKITSTKDKISKMQKIGTELEEVWE